mmetsp:Transcript_60156/g.172781  ORF Transcript_60156/g.172781 Transcript_60156/m.172781 type:complete len:230 (+) Transcript_60156:565-1254(+)
MPEGRSLDGNLDIPEAEDRADVTAEPSRVEYSDISSLKPLPGNVPAKLGFNAKGARRVCSTLGRRESPFCTAPRAMPSANSCKLSVPSPFLSNDRNNCSALAGEALRRCNGSSCDGERGGDAARALAHSKSEADRAAARAIGCASLGTGGFAARDKGGCATRGLGSPTACLRLFRSPSSVAKDFCKTFCVSLCCCRAAVKSSGLFLINWLWMLLGSFQSLAIARSAQAS